MKTYLTKVFFTLFFMSFITSNANDDNLRKLIKNSEFAVFMKAHAINQEKLIKTQNEVIPFPDYNFILYEYTLAVDQRLFIVEDNMSGIIRYFYGEKKENDKAREDSSWIIINKNYENIVNVDNVIDCVKETVAYMKKACSENTTCNITCDLSANCTLYMYIVAYAHCTSGGEAPKASVISNSIN